jgi:archaellum biogenesis ATPase FlaH
MAKSFGINELLKTTFKVRPMSEVWRDHVGNLEYNCTIMIQGPAKNGKTDYTMKFCKELAAHGAKVFYNSSEEGKSGTLQETVKRNNMQDVLGKVNFGNRETFEAMFTRMKKPRSGNVLVIDSWDYMHLTAQQFKTLRETLKHKMIIILCWANGDRPDDGQAKKIEHMADVIIRVNNWVATPVSRFGGNNKMVTWLKKQDTGQQQTLFL